MKLPRLSEEEAQQVDEILVKCREEESGGKIADKSTDYGSTEDDTVNYYRLAGCERQRLADLNAALGVSDELKTKSERQSTVKFVDDVAAKTSSQKIMRSNERKRINWIDEELDRMTIDEPLMKLTKYQVKCADEFNADEYNEFKATRVVNFAYGLND